MDAAFLALHRHRRGRAGVRLHQRLPRRGQRDRGRGLHQGAHPAGGAGARRGDEPGRRADLHQGRHDRRRAGSSTPPTGSAGLQVVFAALIGAITWNLITWYFGLPSSSSHALIGGLVGAALAAAESVQWIGDPRQGRHPDGALAADRLRPGLPVHAGDPVDLPAARNAHKANRGFRYAQILSSAAMAFGHGTQDAQKTMGIITLALVTAGRDRHLRRPAVGHPRLGAGDQRRHLLRRLPHHAHARPADHPAHARPAASPPRRWPRAS